MDDPIDPWLTPGPRTMWTRLRALYQYWLPPFVAAGSLLWLSCVFFLKPVRPPVGVYVACLAGMAVVVTIWPPETNWSKASWLAVFFALTGLEITTLYQERAENQRQQADARKAESDAFESIATGLKISMTENQQAFAATMRKMQGLADLSSEGIKTITGGDGLCMMYFSFVSVASNGTVVGRVSIFNTGKFPLYGIVASILDLDELEAATARYGFTLESMDAGKTDLSIGDLSPKPYGILWPAPIVLSRSDKPIRLNVRFSSTRGRSWVESVRMRRINKEWIAAMQLSKDDPAGKSIIIQTTVPANFPHSANEDIWK
jgi:hypothetical protein